MYIQHIGAITVAKLESGITYIGGLNVSLSTGTCWPFCSDRISLTEQELRTSLWRCSCHEPRVRSSDIFSKAVLPTHPTDLSLPAPPTSHCNVFHATNKLTEPQVPNCYLYAPSGTPKTSCGFRIHWYFGRCLSFQYFSQSTTFRKYI
jgi:hypothetical protein